MNFYTFYLTVCDIFTSFQLLILKIKMKVTECRIYENCIRGICLISHFIAVIMLTLSSNVYELFARK